jgi:transposase
MPYITGAREQQQLFPPSIEEYIGSDDPVRAYDAFVEQLDFAQLGIEIDEHRVGHPEFDPRAMVKLLVYGCSYGIRSSRKLERATHHNLSFIWLVGGLKPDHKTIARFRRNHVFALKNILRQCAQVCLKLGLIEGNTLFVDGTKILASASMKHTWTADRCKKSVEEIDRRIEAILQECETADEGEQEHASLVKLQGELRHQQQLRTKMEKIVSELQQQDRKALNTTDPDAGRMRNGGQIDVGYNCQAVVDERHGLIVHTETVSRSNDIGLFSSQLRAAQDALGKNCEKACADAGYCSPEDLSKSVDQGVDVVVPITRHSDFREHFTYDSDNDVYRCPQGHALRNVGINNRNKSHIYWIGQPSLCQYCPRFGSCTRSSQGRRVERPFTEAVRERLEERYRRSDAHALMQRRKMRAEHPFGHIKHNLGIKAFLMRGRQAAQSEFALAATCFNVTRMIRLIGMDRLIDKLNRVGATRA